MPESLIAALDELERHLREAKADPEFIAADQGPEQELLRPSLPAHRGQALLASTPAGCASSSSARTSTTPVATRSTTCWARRCWPSAWARPASSPRPVPASTASPRPPPRPCMGLECVVYMGAEDTRRQALNVARMQLLGATVIPVTARFPDAQGRHQRGAARLGRQRGQHPLPAGHRRRRAPVPGHGPLLPRGHRRGGPRADPGPGRPPARRRVRLHRRRLQRHRHLPRFPG